MPATILVRSSLNIDEIVRVPHTVRPGETLASSSSQRLIGGKGTNISVAAAQGLGLGEHSLSDRDGAVYLAGAIGSDGTWILPELQQRGVSTQLIQEHPDSFTGTAFIQVTTEGENSIVLRQGANFVQDEQLDNPSTLYQRVVSAIGGCSYEPSVVLLHNEIPYAVTQSYISHRAQSNRDGPLVLWNPSPMPSRDQLREVNWAGVDVLVINEGEASDLLEAIGQQQPPMGAEDDALATLRQTAEFGQISWIVLTRGSRGLLASIRLAHPTVTQPNLDSSFAVPAAKVQQVVDTTGAGDTFTGFLAAAIARAGGLEQLIAKGKDAAQEALAFASLAAAMAVERPGAMASIPTLAEVQTRWQNRT